MKLLTTIYTTYKDGHNEKLIHSESRVKPTCGVFNKINKSRSLYIHIHTRKITFKLYKELSVFAWRLLCRDNTSINSTLFIHFLDDWRTL